jgi:3-deoxy-D-manno-octulosonate 8-phosphate phosphatase (KDO 8-P phosphatase)
MYVGDDMPDYEVMQAVGLAVCPNDAVEDIKTISHYMSPKNGGEGVVRDVLEKILKLKGKWGVQTEIKSV